MQSTEDLTITQPEDVAGLAQGCGWLFIRCFTLVCAGVWLSRASALNMPSTNLMCEVDPWPSVVHSMQVLQGGVVRVRWDIQPEETHWPSGQRGCFQVWSHTCHLQKMWHGGWLEQYHDNNTGKKSTIVFHSSWGLQIMAFENSKNSLLSPTDVRTEVHCRQFEAYSHFLNTACWTVKLSPLPRTSNSSCHWTPAPGHLGLNPIGRQTRWQGLG